MIVVQRRASSTERPEKKRRCYLKRSVPSKQSHQTPRVKADGILSVSRSDRSMRAHRSADYRNIQWHSTQTIRRRKKKREKK